MNDEITRTGRTPLDIDPIPIARPAGPAPDQEPPASGEVAKPLPRRRLGELADEALVTMRRRARHEERPVATPWESVNKALAGGLWPGFYTLTSGSGVGKTQWALQVALAAAEGELLAAAVTDKMLEALATEREARANGKPLDMRPIVYVALELGPLDMVARTVALLEANAGRRTMWSSLAFGSAGEEAIDAAFEANAEELRALPFDVDVAPPHGWKGSALEQIATLRPRLVVIDYLQLVARDRGEDTKEAIARVAYQARAMAREHGTIVLALCSTARTNYAATQGKSGDGKEAPKGPPWERDPAEFIGLGKESGDIEFAADVVLVLINEPREEGASPSEPRKSHLAIAKQRGGPSSWVELRFDGSRFYEPDLSEVLAPPGVHNQKKNDKDAEGQSPHRNFHL